MSQSSHRQATKVTLSPASRGEKAMRKVADLESQLASQASSAQAGKKWEEQASRMRMKLCEMLADCILADPEFAAKNDCIGRLWRTCFYAPIGQLRLRLSKEKRKKGANVATLEQTLKHFLDEAITLYDYLVKKYEEKLLPEELFSPNSQVSSQCSDTFQMQLTSEKTGTVPGLFRMYIHLGDLHRYSASYGTAQSCYTKASQLAPGMGNPYNQLAVIAQLKDAAAPLNCVALYWYARSLLTTHERFEISRSNLSRMFQSNREWYQKLPPVEDLKNGKEMARAKRTAASRQFLASFVDVHFSFFQGVAPSGRKCDVVKEDHVVELIRAQKEPLENLLKASAFGDSLLLKMVSINAFAEKYNPLASFEKADDEEASKVTASLARIHTLSFGACLAERVISSLTKTPEKSDKQAGASSPSVRMLLPLLLLCEFVEDQPLAISDILTDETKGFYDTMLNEFWARIASILNIIKPMYEELGEDVSINGVFKEYEGLRGYSPFQGFLGGESATLENGFVTPHEAVRLLNITLSSQENSPARGENSRQQTTQDSSVSSSPSDETRGKLARFLDFGKRLVDQDERSGSRLFKNEDGTYAWKSENAEPEDNDVVMTESSQAAEETTTMATSQKEGMLMYQVPEGGGLPLLVPGLLLQNRAMDTRAAPAAYDRNKPALATEAHNAIPMKPSTVTLPEEIGQRPAVPPPRVMPPPGFDRPAAPTVVATNTIPIPEQNAGNNVYFQQMGVTPGYAPVNHMGLFPSGESLDLFGGQYTLQTANPFAANTGAPNSSVYPLQGYRDPVFLGANGDGNESSLLGTGLVSSLWLEEGGEKTHNPFAT